MEFKEVESYSQERPLDVDVFSSETTIYIRRNIREEKNKDENGNVIDGMHWKMEEARILKSKAIDVQSIVFGFISQRLNEQDEAIANILLNQVEGILNE